MRKSKPEHIKARNKCLILWSIAAFIFLLSILIDNSVFSLLSKIILIFVVISIANYYNLRKKYILHCDFKKVEKIQTENGCFKAAKLLDNINGIVLHSVKGADLKNYVDFNTELGYCADNWNTKSNTKMPHYFVGYNKDKEIIIINTLTHSHSSFLCGKGEKGSFDLAPNGHLQIIICEREEDDNDYFNNAVFTATIQHCCSLCKNLHLSPEQIVSDKEAFEKGYASDFSSFDAWLTLNNKTMDDFRVAVKNRLKGK